MKRLTLTKEEYLIAKEAFQGGFTHANCFNVGLTFLDVASYDLTSAYPASIVLDRFPMGRGTNIKSPTRDESLFYLQNYACLFRASLWGVKSRFRGDNFLSASKCRKIKGAKYDNGRIMEAEYCETTLTDIDLDILNAFYDFDRVQISDLWYYPRGYLPRNLVRGVLQLYADKTTLKGVEGMEAEYLLKKGLLNSCFGMMVTSLEQALNKYEGDEWTTEAPDIDETLEKYNNSSNRFLFWLWGIFVTAHVRHVIAKAILELGDDYIYSDTDSVKFLHLEAHKAYFDSFNERIGKKIEQSARYHQIELSFYRPKGQDGIERPIGFFDYEGTYKRFKTLGAKRYFVEQEKAHNLGGIDTPYSLTISGVNKRSAIPALVEKAKREKKDIFDYFKLDMVLDENACGKNTHTYCDYEIEGELEDYLGKKAHYAEMSFMHIEPTTYKLTTTEEYEAMIYLDHKQRLQRRDTQRL